jgi:hypothetical protein
LIADRDSACTSDFVMAGLDPFIGHFVGAFVTAVLMFYTTQYTFRRRLGRTSGVDDPIAGGDHSS